MDTHKQLENDRRTLTTLLERAAQLSDQANSLREQLATARAELDATTDEQAAMRLLAKVTALSNQLAAVERQQAEVDSEVEDAQHRYNLSFWRQAEADVAVELRGFCADLWTLMERLQRLRELDARRATAENLAHKTEHATELPLLRQFASVATEFLVRTGYAERRVGVGLTDAVELVRKEVAA